MSWETSADTITQQMSCLLTQQMSCLQTQQISGLQGHQMADPDHRNRRAPTHFSMRLAPKLLPLKLHACIQPSTQAASQSLNSQLPRPESRAVVPEPRWWWGIANGGILGGSISRGRGTLRLQRFGKVSEGFCSKLNSHGSVLVDIDWRGTNSTRRT